MQNEQYPEEIHPLANKIAQFIALVISRILGLFAPRR